MILAVLVACICFALAYSNGANDNFKGVATLYGSGALSYRRAMILSNFMTLLGSLMALIVAKGLLVTFSGKGLVPDVVTLNDNFPLAVAGAAACTVYLATKLGFPISTTHALTGALVGAGLLASVTGVNFENLSASFITPLLISPLLAIFFAMAFYAIQEVVSRRFAKAKAQADCLCVNTKNISVGMQPVLQPNGMLVLAQTIKVPSIVVDSTTACNQLTDMPVFRVGQRQLLNGMHYMSGGLVCFARGLNDTPKIAAVACVGAAMTFYEAITFVAIAMLFGGVISSKKVAHTMAFKVTKMDAKQGATANLTTSLLVIGASKFGLPVSTTHVSCGSLFGIGTATKQAQWRSILGIFAAWVITLPVAAIFAAILFFVFGFFT